MRVHDLWYDFNGNGKVDTGLISIPTITAIPTTKNIVDTVCKDSIIDTLIRATPDTLWENRIVVVCTPVNTIDTIGWTYDTTYQYEFTGAEPNITVSGVMIWADLYPDGVWNTSELVRDVNGNGRYDIPASGDRRWWEYEDLPYWFGVPFTFDQNDFGVAITTSATTTVDCGNRAIADIGQRLGIYQRAKRVIGQGIIGSERSAAAVKHALPECSYLRRLLLKSKICAGCDR